MDLQTILHNPGSAMALRAFGVSEPEIKELPPAVLATLPADRVTVTKITARVNGKTVRALLVQEKI
jgi:hypothetical protein